MDVVRCRAGEGTFTNESTQGWEELDFTTPVQITAGTTYVAGYFAPKGHYAADTNGLSSAVTNSLLTALAGGGVYAYGSSAGLPHSDRGRTTNYWIDVVYQPDAGGTAPSVTAALPSSGATNVPVSAPVKVTFNEPVNSGSTTLTLTDSGGNAVTGTTALDVSGTVLTFTPSSPLAAGTTYTVSVSATSTTGTRCRPLTTWQFVTAGAPVCPCTLFESDATPKNSSANDSSSVTLGVQFTPDTDGWITGVRFYKGAGNTGTHIGNLWTASGTMLAGGHVHQRNGERMADRTVPEPGGRYCGHDVRRGVLRAQRALRRRLGLLRQHSKQLSAPCSVRCRIGGKRGLRVRR